MARLVGQFANMPNTGPVGQGGNDLLPRHAVWDWIAIRLVIPLVLPGSLFGFGCRLALPGDVVRRQDSMRH